MDQKELLNERTLLEAFRRHGEALQARMWTALPVKIVSYNATEQSCVVQPLIQSKIRQPNGTWKDADMPQIHDVPVQFPSGGGWTITFPLKAGDEGTVQFQSRSIDNWWLPPQGAQAGAPQPQAEFRKHDWNDAIFHPGARSKPRWLTGVSTSATQLRADDGNSYIELTASGGGAANLVFPGGVTITAPTVHVINGQLQVDAEITAKYGTGGSVTLTGHKHPQPPDSRGDSEQDTDKPRGGT